MNAFDYFFEHTQESNTSFLIGNESITFRNLFQTSQNIASMLKREVGVRQNILLISANNLFFIKTYLAILKSGNICIPLDPGIEPENFNYVITITKPKLILITNDIYRRLSIDSQKCLFPENIEDVFVENISQIDSYSVNDEDCAEIIFTSGSTGKPKGVMISHKNLIANTNSILAYLNLNQNDRMLVVLPFFYCYGLSLLHTHLRVGASIVLNNSFIFLGKVISNLLDYECTGFAGVPSHFQILLRKSESFKKTAFPALKYVTQAGGGLSVALIDEFRESFPDVKFYVMYGQTEATARLSFLPPELIEVKKGSIGKGIPGVELKVVNSHGKPVEPGETGEIVAHGENIMLGYYADDLETENTVKSGWLYTGDIGTIDEDNYIYLTARKKDIIKVGGKRISPKEIETVILQLPEIVDCVVEGILDDLLGEAIKATVVINKNSTSSLDEQSIKQHCSIHLSTYKIPQVIEFRDQIPLSASGKKLKNF